MFQLRLRHPPFGRVAEDYQDRNRQGVVQEPSRTHAEEPGVLRPIRLEQQDPWGKHTPLVSAQLFQQVQDILRSHNRTQQLKHDFAFTGLLQCAFDDCMVTAEIQKQKYIYYHCNRFKGKCALPFMCEEEVSFPGDIPAKNAQ
jgi:hypothetical protein